MPDEVSALPTQDDPLLRASSERIGGPAGNRIVVGTRWWNVFRVLVVLTLVAATVAYLSKWYCLSFGWGDGRYPHMCYSDIPLLYELRALADGAVPYLTDLPAEEQLEYPVLTGIFVYLAALVTPTGDSHFFFDVNVLGLVACWIIAVLALAVAQRTRPWDAAMLALAPGVILAGFVNWDLLAVALVCVSLAFWSRNQTFWAGVLLGLAAAAKFYPLLFLGPMLLLCWRERRWRVFAVYVAGTALGWLSVNLPFMLANFEGWSRFYTFSRERGEDFGSIWLVLTTAEYGVPPQMLNSVATLSFLVLAAGIAVIVFTAKRTPRVGQLLFLVVAAFVLTNKVYSPQFVVWLIPLAIIARPRWRDFVIWQLGETIYFVSIWMYLEGLDPESKGLSVQTYSVTILVHVAATAWFAAMVIRDIYRPEHDPVTGRDPLSGPLTDPAAMASRPDSVARPPL